MKKINDDALLNVCRIYMDVSGLSRNQFVEELKDLAEQAVPLRFEESIAEPDDKAIASDISKQTVLSLN